MNPVPETAVLDAVLGSCELQLRTTMDRLARLQATLVAEADRIGRMERALADLSAGSRTLAKADPPRTFSATCHPRNFRDSTRQ